MGNGCEVASPPAAGRGGVQVVSATYGPRDVRGTFLQLVARGNGTFTTPDGNLNALFGDTQPNVVKVLRVRLSNGQEHVIREGQAASITVPVRASVGPAARNIEPAVTATATKATKTGGGRGGDPILAEGDVIEFAPAHNESLRVDVQWGNNNNGAKFWLWPANSTAAQRFRVHVRPGGSFSFHPLLEPRRALDITGAAKRQCHLWDATDSNANQSFTLEPANKGPMYFVVRSAKTGHVLDVAGAGGQKAQLLTWDLHGGPNQQFRIIGARNDNIDNIVKALNDIIDKRNKDGALTSLTCDALNVLSMMMEDGEFNAATSLSSSSSSQQQKYPEFDAANRVIALTPMWMRQSRLRLFTSAFEHPQVTLDPSKRRNPSSSPAGGGDNFDYDASVTCLIVKAFRVTAERVEYQTCPLTGHNVMGQLRGLYNFVQQKKALVVACNILADLANSDELAALLSQVVDRAYRCASAKQHGANALITAAGAIVQKRLMDQQQKDDDRDDDDKKKQNKKSRAANEGDDDDHDQHHTEQRPAPTLLNHQQPSSPKQKKTASSSSPQKEMDLATAFSRFFEIVTDFLDDFKMRAFSSAFIEPARLYYKLLGDQTGIDHVNVHGINWYLALAEQSTGVGMPIAMAPDDCLMAFDDHWGGFCAKTSEPTSLDQVWAVISGSKNFGAMMEALHRQLVQKMDTGGASTLSTLVRRQNTRPQVPTSNFVNALKTDANTRRRWNHHVERFAFFFSHQFLVRKLLETLNSEVKPEHAGFRKCCAIIFKEFQKQKLDVKLAPVRLTEEEVDKKTTTSSSSNNNNNNKDEMDFDVIFGRPKGSSSKNATTSAASSSSSSSSSSVAPVVVTSRQTKFKQIVRPDIAGASASHDVRGGGTGREFVRNIIDEGHEGWNKWFALCVPSANTPVTVTITLAQPRVITGYQFVTANDVIARDPTAWSVSFDRGRTVVASEKQQGTQERVSTGRWTATPFYEIPNFAQHGGVKSVTFSFTDVRGPNKSGGIQLGVIRLFEQDTSPAAAATSSSASPAAATITAQSSSMDDDDKEANNKKDETPTTTHPGASYDSFDEFAYNDEYYLDLNVDRVALFFCWLGIIKPPTTPATLGAKSDGICVDKRNKVKWPQQVPFFADTTNFSDAAADDDDDVHLSREASSDSAGAVGGGGMGSKINSTMSGVFSSASTSHLHAQKSEDVFGKHECGICLEIRDDLEILPHVDPVGDVSGHRMCGECRKKYMDNICPFCREVLVCEEFVQLAQQFALRVSGAIEAKGDITNIAAALFEEFQLIEMMHPNPRLLERICSLVLREPRFVGILTRGVEQRKPWLRDMAAVIFRLHAMVVDQTPNGHLSRLPSTVTEALRAAVDLILIPFERGMNEALGLDAHFWGAVYNQALVALSSAMSSGMPTTTQAAIARRTGRALVGALSKLQQQNRRADILRRARDRVIQNYMMHSKELVWGNANDEFAEVFMRK